MNMSSAGLKLESKSKSERRQMTSETQKITEKIIKIKSKKEESKK